MGVASALSGSLLTTNTHPEVLDVLRRIPLVIFWNWLSLFLFDVDNQLQEQSIVEDSVNKSWRAIPAGRLSASEARAWMLFIIPAVFLCTLVVGGTSETVTLMVMTFMYNDFNGADVSILTRNWLNAFGYMCYSSGSMIVATGYGQHELNDRSKAWLAIIGGIIFTTLQMQDMPDVKGDAARGRRTVPLVYGDTFARWSIAIPVMSWSVFVPTFWELSPLGYLAPVLVGGYFSGRLLTYRGPTADGSTWKCWCLWMTVMYLVPLSKRIIETVL